MVVLQKRKESWQHYPLGIPRHSYDEDLNHTNSHERGGDRRSHHPMDVVYLDNSKTPTVPPYLRALPTSNNNGNDHYRTDGPAGAALKIKANDRGASASGSSEEADAAAGSSTTPRYVLERVTSLSSFMSSSALSALGGGREVAGETAASNANLSGSNKDNSSGAKSSSKTTMLNQYYNGSNYDNIHNNPNHRNYRHHLYLRNMNMAPNQHLEQPISTRGESPSEIKPSWRLRDRMKTVGVGLIMALNVGTDPPDVIKPHPCAKLQCWMDPSSVTRAKAKEKIGERLEKQYARWQQQRGGSSSSSSTNSSSRPFKYRKTLDPTVEDVRALCLWLRKQARHERILLHYNGHGVPRPTPNGEIWVFDKNHTEYIPLSVSDLRQWVGKPTIVILDCSSAGILIPFLTAPPAETPTNTPPRMPSPILNGSSGVATGTTAATTAATDDDPIISNMDEAASHWVKDTIVLCPTSEGEWLPMSPEYPADIFTSCLTTPIQMALRWFVRNNRISMGLLFNEKNSNSPGDDWPDIWVDSIPGQANDRKTPLGELNWIFTSVTDSIAWNVLPKPLFQRLFRQDLLVASMFRNFLLADRILRNLNCTPQSYPPLPPGVADHPLWQAWDLACETCLFGLIKDGVLGCGPTAGLSDNSNSPDRISPPHHHHKRQQAGIQRPSPTTPKTSSISSPFFSEQLTGFEVWLEYASIHKGNNQHLQPPEQLPVVLQVLLSQAHRVRALELLRRFLALGPWAVNLALSLGIFPYVGKLLQSSEYKTVLVHIWASILKFDPSCQVDLSKDKSLKHFIQPLSQFSDRTGDSNTSHHNTPEAAKQRTLNAFCLASLCFKYPNAQNECLRQNLHGSCAALLSAQIKLREQQKQQLKEQGQVPSRRASQDATQYTLLLPIAREWICMCLGNLVQAFQLAQAQAYDIELHDLLIMLQQDDEDPNVRAAATYALGNLLEHASLPSSNNQPTSTFSSSSSRTRLQPNPPPLTTMAPPTIGTPTPISLGPQAFSNTGPGILSSQGQLQPQPHQQQMFLPSPIPAAGVSAGPSLSATNTFPGQLHQKQTIPANQGPASAALAAAMVHGGLAPIQNQLSHAAGQKPLPVGMRQQQQQQQQQQIQNPIPQKIQGGAQVLSGVPPMLSTQAILQQGNRHQHQHQHQHQQQGMPQITPTLGALAPQHPPGVAMVGIGRHLPPGQPLLTRTTSGPQLGAGQQGALFHPQRSNVPSIGGYLGPTVGNPIGMMASPNLPPAPPVGMPIVGSPLGIGASAVGSPIVMKQMRVAPHLVEQQPRRRPTVYEDLRRILFDLKVMESMMKVLADGSAIVRYEVVMGFSNFVEKYLQAILVIAEDATRVMDTIRLGKISEDEEGDTSTSRSRESRTRVVSLPKGVNQKIMERFEECWRALRKIQHEDPHPNVSGGANKIVRVVHETLYDMRMELDSTKDRNKVENGLSGIQEEGETGGEGMDRVKSDANISMASPDQIGNISRVLPQSDGPPSRLPTIKPKPYPLRRSASEAGGGNFPSVNTGDTKSLPSLAIPGRNLMDRVKAENLLPKSQLYKWKKSIFKPDFDDELEEDHDPLNPLEAARNYQNRRNNIVREAGNKLSKHFERLNPRRERRSSGLNVLLDENDDDANEDSDILLQTDLRLKEKNLLRNSGGVKMTSMLKFHSYENALVVCDNQDYVSIWNYEKGIQKSSFKNGNPAGSRMTSTFWINESSTSLLFVGCDDGSARIWRGAIQNNGQISSSAPTLESSFFAIPDMEAGQRSKSGLICEWQQRTGTLISGGNSRHIRCWDMTAEKCSTTIDIESDSCITALTTAWDEDHSSPVQRSGFYGNGPDIIVAGFSDGTLKLFDIRTPTSAAALSAARRTNGNIKGRGKAVSGGRRRGAAGSLHNRTFNEHGSWIVDVSFTSYGGSNQNEILSGSVAGDIRAWDIRTPSRSLRDIEVQRSPMTALSVHKKIPIAATGSHAQFIKILTLEGETLQVARFHEESLPGHRIGPVSCLEFHKQKLVLAAGSTNALVSIYQPRKPLS